MATRKEEVRTLLNAAKAEVRQYQQMINRLDERRGDYTPEGYVNRKTQIKNSYAPQYVEYMKAASKLVNESREALEKQWAEQEAAVYADANLTSAVTTWKSGVKPTRANLAAVVDKYRDNPAALTLIRGAVGEDINLFDIVPKDSRAHTIGLLNKVSDRLANAHRDDLDRGMTDGSLDGTIDFIDGRADNLDVAE